ncbi:MAG: hypothetical protein MK207_10700 [Saprospiraceae bacterium]|nr:hypothetical protein [Saprospiraceae bacterium]
MGLKFFCILILGVFACSKVHQWKKPVKITFNVDVTKDSIADGKLIFESGYLDIESFNFDGNRINGSDVFFTKTLKSKIITNSNKPIKEDLIFDIPQGIYSSINIDVLSMKDNLPNLVIKGEFQNESGVLIPVRFEFNETETFEIVGQNYIGNNNDIDLVEIDRINATIWIDPSNWFKGVSINSIENAKLVPIDGRNVILINDNTNQYIYKTVVAALSVDKQKAIFIKQGHG